MATLPSPDFLALQEALAGHYSLERELGRGGMGVVYLAHEVRLDRFVALKVLPPADAARADLRERFLREARTAARLSHPHIVPIHAVHELGDVVFFAMSYVEGETLGERIRSRGPLPPRDAARILREVAWALAYAHAQGVIHRDVKPDNILLEAGSGRALVTDFGIAQVAAGAGLTGNAEVLGTVEFMSPEQANGEPLDERSDLYALGVVGYYMVSGRLPLQGATPAATLAKRLMQVPEPLAAVSPALPAPLTLAVDRCLARDRAERLADGEAFADAMTRALEERREVPVALRLFIKQNRESTASLVAMASVPLGLLALMASIFTLAGGSMGPPLGPMITATAIMLALASTPAAVLMQMARRLLRSGYDHHDLLRAMRDDLDERRGELTTTYGPDDTRLDRWLRRVVGGGLAAHVTGLTWLAFGPYVPGVPEAVVGLMSAAGLTWVGAGVVSAVRHQLRGPVAGRGWLRFWEGPLGRTLFKVAGLRLEPAPAGTPYGPTELAIGIAAGRLYEALPAEQRRAFPELPEVVRRLEADAEAVRAHIAGLDALLQDVGGVGARPGVASADSDGARSAEDHHAPEHELAAARAAAEARLRRTVAALESIRVELLRLHAGGGSVASVTLDLAAAKELSEDLARALEGVREVDRFLGLPVARELAAPLTPA